MSKRGNGEGSIYRRSDGKWVGALTEDGGGRRVVYGATRHEADAKLQALRTAQADAQPLPRGRGITLEQFAPTWIDAVEASGRRAITVRRYEQLLRIHVRPRLGRIPLPRLLPEDLDRLYRAKLEEGLAPTTVHHIHAAIHRLLAHAERRGVVSRNVASLVDAPAIQGREMRTLDEDEVRRLLEDVAGDRLEALYVVLFTTGMRVSELLGLRWRDVELGSGEIRLRSTLERYHRVISFSEPKTKGSRRRIPLARQATDALRRHRVTQAQDRLAAGPAWVDRDLVFTSELGEPVAYSTLRRAYRTHLRRAGAPDIRIHDGRHTAATTLLGRGVHPKIVSEMLGHSRIATTMDLYSHVTPAMQAQAVSAMEAALGGSR